MHALRGLMFGLAVVALPASALAQATRPTAACAPGSYCVAPARTPVAACRASFPQLDGHVAYGPATCELKSSVVATDGSGLRAAILEVHDDEMGIVFVLALGGTRGYDRIVPFFTANESPSGAETVTFQQMRFEDVVPGGIPELIVEASSVGENGDCEGSSFQRTVSTEVSVCATAPDGRFACRSRIPRSQRTVEITTDEHGALLEREVDNVSFDVSFADGQVIASLTRGDRERYAGMTGRRPILAPP